MNNRFEITEIFMAKYGLDNYYYGTIRRENDIHDNPIVFGNIKINDGFIIANAKDQWELRKKLDELALINIELNINQNEN